jgi:hypothetical protein
MDKKAKKRKRASYISKDSPFLIAYKEAIKNATKGKVQYSEVRVDEKLMEAFKRAVAPHADGLPKLIKVK